MIAFDGVLYVRCVYVMYVFGLHGTFLRGMQVGIGDKVTKCSLSCFEMSKDKDNLNFIILKEKLQCGLKNYSTKITT